MEKQRLSMQIAFTENEISNKINSLCTDYSSLLTGILPFSNEQNSRLSHGIEWINIFLFEKIFKTDKPATARAEIIKFIIRLTQVFVIRVLGRIWYRKK